MAVKITDSCITCGSCIDECPVSAIVDCSSNPDGEDRSYVYADKCVECVGYNDMPACASACPVDGCIVWGDIASGQPSRSEVTSDMRNGETAVIQ